HRLGVRRRAPVPLHPTRCGPPKESRPGRQQPAWKTHWRQQYTRSRPTTTGHPHQCAGDHEVRSGAAQLRALPPLRSGSYKRMRVESIGRLSWGVSVGGNVIASHELTDRVDNVENVALCHLRVKRQGQQAVAHVRGVREILPDVPKGVTKIRLNMQRSEMDADSNPFFTKRFDKCIPVNSQAVKAQKDDKQVPGTADMVSTAEQLDLLQASKAVAVDVGIPFACFEES